MDGDKINDWSDFYDIMQKEIDVVNYDKKFGKNSYTYNDFATDIELFNEVKKKNMKGIVIILNYTKNFENIEEGEKGCIYYDTIFTLLLEWYRDLRIVYKQEKPTIDIELYILIDNSLLNDKEIGFKNELIIAIEGDTQQITKEYGDYGVIKFNIEFKIDELFNEKLEKEMIDKSIMEDRKLEYQNNNCIEKLNTKLKKYKLLKMKLLLFYSDKINFYRKNVLTYIVESILIKKYKENKEIKIYMIFSDDIF